MVISTGAEKAQGKIQYPFNKNFQKEIGIKSFSNSIKSIYKNLTASILPNGEKPTAECILNPKIRNKARMPALTKASCWKVWMYLQSWCRMGNQPREKKENRFGRTTLESL